VGCILPQNRHNGTTEQYQVFTAARQRHNLIASRNLRRWRRPTLAVRVLLQQTKKEELTCEGHWRDTRQPDVAYVVLTQYRWWVNSWSDSHGNVKAQTDKNAALVLYIPFIDKIGEDSLTMFMFKDGKHGKLRGGFRTANGEITIAFRDDLVFLGTCRKRPPH
jgi:hypothetical protein